MYLWQSCTSKLRLWRTVVECGQSMDPEYNFTFTAQNKWWSPFVLSNLCTNFQCNICHIIYVKLLMMHARFHKKNLCLAVNALFSVLPNWEFKKRYKNALMPKISSYYKLFMNMWGLLKYLSKATLYSLLSNIMSIYRKVL